MADNNRNWGNQSNQYNQDWEQNRNRYNQGDDSRNLENYGDYGNVNYGSDYHQNQGMRGSYGQNDYGGAYSSDYGSQYGSGYNESDYGNRNRMQNEGSWKNMGSSYGSQQRRVGDWDRNRENMGSAGMYGGDFGQEDWDRNDYRSNVGRSNYGLKGYGNRLNTSGGSGEDYNRGMGRSGYSNMDRSQNRDFMGAGETRDRSWWDRTRDEVSSWFGDDDAQRRRRVDDQASGGYRGRGPKGYHRSEQRIREDVCDRLSEDDWLDASDIDVKVQGEEVILTGSVHSREDKRRAEDLIEVISGVRNVENRLRVEHGESASSSGTIGNTSSSTSNRTTGTERNRNK